MATITKPGRAVSQSLLRLQSDARLAQLARDGHEPAFEALVQRYRPEMVRAANRIVGPDRGEDAVQQALLNAHRAIDTTENVQNLRAWLHKIGHNSSLNALRALRDEVPIDAGHTVVTGATNPADAAELSEQLRDTFAAIDRLPENQRAALLLRELEGRSHEDIADALGLSAGAARQQLMRARRGVRQAMTALTPYPLIAALSGQGPNSGLAELLFGAGASATAVKLGAGVAATGAIAGGVFGASVAVQTHETSAATHSKTVVTNTTPAVTNPAGPSTVIAGQTRGEDDHRGRGRSNDRSESDDRGRGHGKSANSEHERSGSSDDTSSGSGSGDSRSAGRGHSGRDDVTGSESTGPRGSGGSASSGDSSGAGDSAGSGGGSGNSGRGGDD